MGMIVVTFCIGGVGVDGLEIFFGACLTVKVFGIG